MPSTGDALDDASNHLERLRLAMDSFISSLASINLVTPPFDDVPSQARARKDPVVRHNTERFKNLVGATEKLQIRLRKATNTVGARFRDTLARLGPVHALPPETLRHIFNYLKAPNSKGHIDYKSLRSIEQVSKYWRNVAKHQSLWSTVTIRPSAGRRSSTRIPEHGPLDIILRNPTKDLKQSDEEMFCLFLKARCHMDRWTSFTISNGAGRFGRSVLDMVLTSDIIPLQKLSIGARSDATPDCLCESSSDFNPPPLKQIHTLILRKLSLGTAQELVAPNLTKLCIFNCVISDSALTALAINLSSLQSLQIIDGKCVTTEENIADNQHVTLRSLRSLDLLDADPPAIELLLRHWDLSELTSLAIRGHLWDHSKFSASEILNRTPYSVSELN